MARGVSQSEDDRSQSGEIDLRALGSGVWRRKRWIVGPTLLAALLAAAFVFLSSPYYRSSSLVLIENRESAAPRQGLDRETPLPDEQAVVSQAQLIQSRDLTRSVVKTLDLGRDPEFAPKDGLIKRFLHAVGFGAGQGDMPPSEKVVDKVAENLQVFPVSGSRVVGVEFVSVNPDTAAKVVNGFVDAYLDIQRGAKREANRQASQYLADEIATMRGRVGEAEDRVEAFRAKAGLLVGANNTTLAAQQLGEATNQLTTSRTQQAEARAKADMIRSVLRQGRPAEALEIANSELVRQLAQRRSELAAQIVSEGRTLLPQHPRMRELSGQLQGLEQQVRNEAEKLARAYENDAKTAGARVAALDKQLDGLKASAATANGQDVQLRALEREARSQRDLLEQMLARYREASARDNPEALLADARVISRGAAATEPYFPKKAPTILLVTLAAFALSLFAAAAAEVFSSQRVGADDEAAPPLPPAVGETPVFGRLRQPIEQPAADAPKPAREARSPIAGLAARLTSAAASLASVTAAKTPETNAATARPAAPVDEPPQQKQPSPARAASIEFADTTLIAALARQLASTPTADGALKILVTGAKPRLGVGSIASKLANEISQSGRRVVMIDAGGGDARDGATGGPGLSELLTGEATFAQAIHRDAGSRVHVVPAGDDAFVRLDSAAQGRLGVVLDALALTYDFVVLTTPTDPGAFGRFGAHCAAAVLVSNAGAADHATVDAHEKLKASGIDDVVVVLVPGGGGPRDGSLAAA